MHICLFDIDGTLIESGGAGAVSWRMAFEDLYVVPADIGKYTDAGMTDPQVGRLTFESVIGREPTIRELAQEGMTCVIVTHEMGFAREIAGEVYFTDRGLVVEHGPPAEFFNRSRDPRTRQFLSQIL